LKTVDKELTQQTIKKVLKGADLVIDAFDNRKSRQLLQEYCREAKLNCIHAGMFQDYGEIVWDKEYTVPQETAGAQDVCEYPLARNLVSFVVTILAEEVVDFFVSKKPRLASWSITLKDLSIRRYR
jgi:molybdopterin/thiamine biosynthesis adenylyltransferase